MYVCLCKGITEKELEERGKHSSLPAKKVCSRMGVGTDCGSCMAYATEVLEKLQPEKKNQTQKS